MLSGGMWGRGTGAEQRGRRGWELVVLMLGGTVRCDSVARGEHMRVCQAMQCCQSRRALHGRCASAMTLCVRLSVVSVP